MKMQKQKSIYETDTALEQYLFFHYGKEREYLPWPGPSEALHYPVAAVNELLDTRALDKNARALDLGCAVGRTSFELSRHCREVVGIDLSKSFIRAANQMKRRGSIALSYIIEGDLRGETILRRPAGVKADRVYFRVGDAMKLPRQIGRFDVAVLLNLIDRVPNPAQCLRNVTERLNAGGQLIIASPYTWMEEHTPRTQWLGGRKGQTTLDALKKLLLTQYQLVRHRQIPFIIREHARKYQWSMAEGTCWVKKRK